MYANNSFSRRRVEGWAERRRQYRRQFEKAQAQAQAARKNKPQKKT